MNERNVVIERDNGCCVLCHKPGTGVHHVVKRGHAKICPMVNTRYNLVCLCQKCHDKAHNQNSRYECLKILIDKYGIDVYNNEKEDFWRDIIRRGIE